MPSWIRSRNGSPGSVALGDRDDEAEVRLHHRLLRAVVAALDPLRELDLLRRREERHLADVLQEELQRVGRDLRVRLDLGLDVVVRRDDRDPRLLERGVELVDLRRLELELVERQRDLVRVEAARCGSRSRGAAAPRPSRGRPRSAFEGSRLRILLRPDQPPFRDGGHTVVTAVAVDTAV